MTVVMKLECHKDIQPNKDSKSSCQKGKQIDFGPWRVAAVGSQRTVATMVVVVAPPLSFLSSQRPSSTTTVVTHASYFSHQHDDEKDQPTESLPL